MKFFSRYPHVKELIDHYARVLHRPDVAQQQTTGVRTEHEAEQFSLFIWQMVQRMNQDDRNGVKVLGATNNTEMIQDVYYEVSEFMAECGFEDVWRRVCSDA